jgi:peptidoglycan/LPS O-acetylase OafA/YrhL
LKRIFELDGIRGLAVTSVVTYHVCFIVTLHSASTFTIGTRVLVGAFLSVLGAGWLGVDIFFVLSGYLITTMLLEERSLPNFWRSFYSRRTIRLLPPFFVVLFVCLASTYLLFPAMRGSGKFIWGALFFVANWMVLYDIHMPLLGHLWSLAVEEQFYLVWPQAAARLGHQTLLILALGVATGSEVLRAVLMNTHLPHYAVLFITPARIDGICIGSAVALSMEMPKVRGFLIHHWNSFAAIFGYLAIFSLATIRIKGADPDKWMPLIMIPLIVMLTSMVIIGAVDSRLPVSVKRFLGNRILIYLGKRSYALYLIHEPIRVAVSQSLATGYFSRLPRSLPVDLTLIAATITASLFLAEISWRFLEIPAQNFRRRALPAGRVQDRTIPTPGAGILAIAAEA